MKKQPLIILFFLLLFTDMAAIGIKNTAVQYLSKSLLMPVLAMFFVINTARFATPLKKWILAALFFSWAGDVLLMFQDTIPDFFLFGLSAFLLAHIFYIIFFHGIRMKEGIKGKLLLLIPVAIYYTGLIMWLSPYLGDMKIPVRIYGLVISFMLILALHMLFVRNKEAAKYLGAGALLFVVSDSVLAVDKFYQPFETAGIVIMLTYGAAQYLLVKGACLYIRPGNPK